jgi:hypothetical protein
MSDNVNEDDQHALGQEEQPVYVTTGDDDDRSDDDDPDSRYQKLLKEQNAAFADQQAQQQTSPATIATEAVTEPHVPLTIQQQLDIATQEHADLKLALSVAQDRADQAQAADQLKQLHTLLAATSGLKAKRAALLAPGPATNLGKHKSAAEVGPTSGIKIPKLTFPKPLLLSQSSELPTSLHRDRMQQQPSTDQHHAQQHSLERDWLRPSPPPAAPTQPSGTQPAWLVDHGLPAEDLPFFRSIYGGPWVQQEVGVDRAAHIKINGPVDDKRSLTQGAMRYCQCCTPNVT